MAATVEPASDGGPPVRSRASAVPPLAAGAAIAAAIVGWHGGAGRLTGWLVGRPHPGLQQRPHNPNPASNPGRARLPNPEDAPIPPSSRAPSNPHRTPTPATRKPTNTTQLPCRHLAVDRPHRRLRRRPPPQPRHTHLNVATLRPPTQPPGHPLSRPPPQPRNPHAARRNPPKNRLRTPRPRKHRHHPRHLHPPPTQHANRSRRSNRPHLSTVRGLTAPPNRQQLQPPHEATRRPRYIDVARPPEPRVDSGRHAGGHRFLNRVRKFDSCRGHASLGQAARVTGWAA
jgi:hypothetical protein